MRVLFLIVARGGSKSIPKKNLLKIHGISLVGFKAISARKCKYCTKLVISTDSQEIQEDARQYGVDVLFTRPAILATDTAATDDVILHAMEYIKTQTNERYDAVMLLEPSSPFATHHDYEKAVEMMLSNNANVILGMREVSVNSIFQGPMDNQLRIGSIIRKIMNITGLRRQDVAQEYTMNGALYLMKWDFFEKHRNRYCDPDNTYGLIMKREYSLEIDEGMDYEYAQFLVERGHVDISYWK